MKLSFSLTAAAALLAGTSALSLRADIVTDWNRIACETIQHDTTLKGPTWASRNLAMVHAAMYDAVNSVDRTHQAYQWQIDAPAGTSMEAAAAQSAYRVLVNQYPGQKPALDAALANSLSSVPNGAGKTNGVALGENVSNHMIAWRSTDGANNVGTYTGTGQIGEWTPDPLHPGQQPLGVGWGNVTPFAISNTATYRGAPPPALNSAAYAAAYSEVKAYGAKNSVVRTADQTQIGVFWGYDRGGLGPPPVLYNENVRQIAAQQGNTMVQNARLFALVNLAQADAGISCWDTKYTYNFWRPITAIRAGELDGNALTEGDSQWEPLGAPSADPFTPPFPAYASGHATFGAAVFRTVSQFYGTDLLSFDLTSDEVPGVTRHYNSFSQVIEENGQSRIYLGIHWAFDKTQGIECGDHISYDIYGNYLQAVPEPGSVAMFVTMGLSGAGLLIRRRRK